MLDAILGFGRRRIGGMECPAHWEFSEIWLRRVGKVAVQGEVTAVQGEVMHANQFVRDSRAVVRWRRALDSHLAQSLLG